jgi:hypothetical protein
MKVKNTVRPRRIQRRRVKGWKMPPNTVYVGRPTKWGDHFEVGPDSSHEDVVRAYRCWIEDDRFLASHLIAVMQKELAGRNLACWCPLDKPCHADILLEMANK